MDPIEVEPLNSAPLVSLVPYDTSEDEIPAAKGSGQKESSPIKS